jgi:hypothetical protein
LVFLLRLKNGSRFRGGKEEFSAQRTPRISAEFAEKPFGDDSLPRRMKAVFSKEGICSRFGARVCRMPVLTSHEALQLTASFAITAERMKTSDINFCSRAAMLEAASRVTFLKAHLIAKKEESAPRLGEISRRAVFAAA